MGVHTRFGRWRFAPLAILAVATVTGLTACADRGATGGNGPVLPGNPPIPPQYRGAAWQFEISPQKRTVKVIPPTSSTVSGATNSLFAPSLDVQADDQIGVSKSLLGAEVVDISVVPGSFVAGPLNNPSPGKRTIQFDIQVNNKLNGVDLIAPTFPTPPAGTSGPILFPFEITTVSTSGGATGGAGAIVVVPPRGGQVSVNAQWDGTLFNFFNDVGCGANSNDCFRWEEFSAVNAGGSSGAKSIGFDIDASVGDFTVKVILAADLRNAGGPTQFGTVAGNVTSPQIGNISGATVNVSGGFTGTTAANGSYSIGNVGVGSRTVTVTGLPASCTAPAAQNVTVTNGGTATADFTVQCTAPTGTVAGTISSSLGGGLVGVAVTVTPTGGSASPVFTTPASGAYSVSVPVGPGTGTVTLGNLPVNCTNPGPTAYTGLTSGGTVTTNITVTCTAPPQVGTVNGTVTRSDNSQPITGATVTLTPTGGSALAGVTTNGTGQYSRTGVPLGGGNIAVTTLPAGCTFAGTTYAGVTNGGTVTVNITATCAAPAFQYPLTGTWGAITNTGPTGRQVVLLLAIDMGAAPGNPTVNGNAADELAAIQGTLNYTSNALITYASSTRPDPNLDFGAGASPTPGITNFSATSSQQLTGTGVFTFFRIVYNITTGATGTVNVATTITSALAGSPIPPQVQVAGNVVATIPPLVIP